MDTIAMNNPAYITDSEWKEIEKIAIDDPVAHHFVYQAKQKTKTREQAAIGLALHLLKEKNQLLSQIKSQAMLQPTPPIVLNVTKEQADEILSEIQKNPEITEISKLEL